MVPTSRRGAIFTLLLTVSGAACLDEQVTRCRGGLVCPADKACDEAHQGCVDREQLEACSGKREGEACSYEGTPEGICYDGVCLPGGCGNGRLDTGETCDDGNRFHRDGCSADCHSDEKCGNGVVDSTLGEMCEPSASADTACRPDCTSVSCGDGILDEERFELCDDGSANSDAPDAACRRNCQPKRCGDRVRDSGEACDDGNLFNGDGCSHDCSSLETCGNGHHDLDEGEQCDDGNLLSHDGCSSGCRVESPRWRVELAASPPLDPFGATYDASIDSIVVYESNGFRLLQRGVWSAVADEATSPRSRDEHRLVWQAARQRTLLFGGADLNPWRALDETWEWDGARWQQLFPAHSPPPRALYAAAYDAARGRTVLYGGWNGTTELDDTWEWDGADWQRIDAGAGPAPGRHTMTYDPRRGAVVMFDGLDLWAFAGRSWERLPMSPALELPEGPSSLAYDGVRDHLVLFAGGSTLAYADGALVDLDVDMPESSLPDRAELLFLPRARTLALVLRSLRGGATYMLSDGAWRPLDKTLRSLPLRGDAAMVYDPLRGLPILFGGADDVYFDETFVWDRAFRPVETEHTPPARRSHALAYDGAANAILLFGGMSAEGQPLGDTWSFDGVDWHPLLPQEAPGARMNHAMVTDADGGIVLYGGLSQGVELDDMWRWQGGTWQPLGARQPPGPRRTHEMAYDRARERVVLFGSFSPDDAHTWEWDGATWLTSVEGPGIREDHGLAYDANRQRTHLFGGYYDEGIDWEWSGIEQGWSKVRPETQQFELAPLDPFLTYDAVHERLLAAVPDRVREIVSMYEFAYVAEDTPEESCQFGFDTDLDGLRGCDDPDCWGFCTPLCPPGARCADDLSRCGDGVCNEALETFRMCPADCPGEPLVCGDFFCDAGETQQSCPGDCHP